MRLLCLSRNLTFDRSWDTLLRLDSNPLGGDRKPTLDPKPLQAFLTALPQLAQTALSRDRADQLAIFC